MWKAPNDDVYVGKTICNRLIGLVMLMSWGDLKVFHTKALLRLRPGRPALMLEQPSTSDSSEQEKLMIRKNNHSWNFGIMHGSISFRNINSRESRGLDSRPWWRSSPNQRHCRLTAKIEKYVMFLVEYGWLKTIKSGPNPHLRTISIAISTLKDLQWIAVDRDYKVTSRSRSPLVARNSLLHMARELLCDSTKGKERCWSLESARIQRPTMAKVIVLWFQVELSSTRCHFRE